MSMDIFVNHDCGEDSDDSIEILMAKNEETNSLKSSKADSGIQDSDGDTNVVLSPGKTTDCDRGQSSSSSVADHHKAVLEELHQLPALKDQLKKALDLQGDLEAARAKQTEVERQIQEKFREIEALKADQSAIKATPGFMEPPDLHELTSKVNQMVTFTQEVGRVSIGAGVGTRWADPKFRREQGEAVSCPGNMISLIYRLQEEM